MSTVRLEVETTDDYARRHPGCLNTVRPARRVTLEEPTVAPPVENPDPAAPWYTPTGWWGQPMDVGRMYVVQLDGALCFGGVANRMSRATGTHDGGQLLVTADATLIDDSFKIRHKARTLPDTLITREDGEYHLTIDDEIDEQSGDFVLLGATYPGHFGHFLIEGLARAWLPGDATYVVFESGFKPWQAAILSALGITKIHHVNRPTRFERLIVPSAACNLHRWMAPEMGYTWGRVRDAVAPGVDELVYLSRSKFTKRRALVNELEVEDLFASLGFTIVHPQQRPVMEQVAIAAGARVLAGSGGSNMYLGAFQLAGHERVILSPQSFTLCDDAQISHVVGTRLSYVLGDPIGDTEQPRYKDYSVSLEDVERVVRAAIERTNGGSGVR